MIRSKVRPLDIPDYRREFIGALRQRYTIRTFIYEEVFYTISRLPNEILISVDVIRVRLTFPLDPFVVAFFNGSKITPIQLTPNSWAYLFGFTKYAKQILKAKPSIALFRSMFIIATKGTSDCTYTFFRADIEVMAKFKALFSKIRD